MRHGHQAGDALELAVPARRQRAVGNVGHAPICVQGHTHQGWIRLEPAATDGEPHATGSRSCSRDTDGGSMDGADAQDASDEDVSAL